MSSRISRLVDKHGEVVPHGSVIRWNVSDNEEGTVWTFTGIVVDCTQLPEPFNGDTQYVTYMGGGLDFGSAIGKKIKFDEVIETSEANEPHENGIQVVLEQSELARYLSRFATNKGEHNG